MLSFPHPWVQAIVACDAAHAGERHSLLAPGLPPPRTPSYKLLIARTRTRHTLILRARMISHSTLNSRWVQLLRLLREFVLYVKTNGKIDRRLPPVMIFLALLFGLSVVAVVYTLRRLILDFNNRRALRRRPRLVRQSLEILRNGLRLIVVSLGGRERVVEIPKALQDRYESDKYVFKNFERDLKLDQQRNRLVGSKFLKQLGIIWQILVPKVFDANLYYLVTQCLFLVLRTWLLLLVARLDGQIVKDIIGGNGRLFIRDLVYWFALAFPALYTNAAIKYLTLRLSILFRTNLMRYIHDLYMDKEMIYYKLQLSNIQLDNIDQYITNDVTQFCDLICDLFTLMGKPAMDLIFFSVYLRDNLGTAGIAGIFFNYFLTGLVLKSNTPAFGKLAKQRLQLEGDYYNAHLNLITNCEEIAFYKGLLLEKIRVNGIFATLMRHVKKEHWIQAPYLVLEDYILKYTWLALGYLFALIPIFVDELMPGSQKATAAVSASRRVREESNMRQFIVNKRLMLSLADAGLRLMYSIKDLDLLTGYTDRVFLMLLALHEVHSSEFCYGDQLPNDILGTVQNGYNGLRLEKLPVVVPLPQGSEGVHLMDELLFLLKPHLNLLILATNGAGKTLIARTLAGLWPVYRGLVSRPRDADIYYLPQKTYFSAGTLRDQVIYPYLQAEMVAMGKLDEDLFKVLKDVKLEYLLKREGGWDVRKDWKDVFLGGEKQRMLLARVVFKRPQFVVLDEGTNAVSSDVEDYLFDMLRKKQITFITLLHRPLLIKYHDYLLEVHEDKHWDFVALGTDEGINSVEKEMQEIKHKLALVEAWEQRKSEVEAYLDGKVGGDSIAITLTV